MVLEQLTSVKTIGLLPLCLLLCIGCSGTDSENGSQSSNGKQAVGYMPEGAVIPGPDTIESGAYAPLSRPLFLYVNKQALKRPEVVAFLQFYISDTGQELVREVGYVQLSSKAFQQTQATLAKVIEESGTKVDGDVAGEIKIDGSSTVYPVSQRVAEEFTAKHHGFRPVVAKSGTSGGMKRFYVGEIDICDASRAIKDTEVEQCKQSGVEFVELKIGIDGLTVVVNSDNDGVDRLTVDELKKIGEPGSTIKTWKDLNPEFPGEEIALYGPDTDSGTFEYFTEEICGEAGASRSDYNQNPDDNFLVTGVAGSKYALGYFGYAYYAENQDSLKALGVANVSDNDSEESN